jgi:protein-L-isoaspartate(D-aspartate) O-methyltransferase
MAKSLLSQLKVGGKLVAPVGDLDVQKMILVHRVGDNEYQETTHGRFNFVPLTGTNGWSIILNT